METVHAEDDPGLIMSKDAEDDSEAQLLFLSQRPKTSWVLQFWGFTVSQRDIISTKGALFFHL